jgi:hypothetical protein
MSTLKMRTTASLIMTTFFGASRGPAGNAGGAVVFGSSVFGCPDDHSAVTSVTRPARWIRRRWGLV